MANQRLDNYQKISVAMCTCNGEKYIEEQIKSILKQTVLPDEIIICDDASTDRTVEIILKIQSSTELITLYVNNPPLNTVKNFSKAISLCTGNWIFLCDQDDIWDENRVKVMMNAISGNTLMLFSNARLIMEDGASLESTLWEEFGFDDAIRKRWENSYLAFKDLFNYKNYVTGATSMINRRLLTYAFPISVPDGYYHDAWFAMHAAARKGLQWLTEPTISYRIHASQQVGLLKENENKRLAQESDISIASFQKRELRKYPLFWIRYKIDLVRNYLSRKY